MNTLDSHLMTLYERGLIPYGELITKSQDPGAVMQTLQEGGLAKQKG